MNQFPSYTSNIAAETMSSLKKVGGYSAKVWKLLNSGMDAE